MMVRRSSLVLLTSTLLSLLASAVLLPAAAPRGEERAAETIRDGFESPRPAWRQEQTDASINLMAHERSKRAAHEGRSSERFQFVAGTGSSFFYSYPLPRIPITEELRISLFVRSNRPGVRLFGRVVLPGDTDPETGQPSFVMIAGTSYENIDRWQRLEIREMVPSIERQARVLRAATRRAVSLKGAYLEQLAVNLFGGAGETEVFLDELMVTPVPPEAFANQDQPRVAEAPAPDALAPDALAPAPPTPKTETTGSGRIEFDRNRLRRRGDDGRYYDWLFTTIRSPETPVVKLRLAGFDVLSEPLDAEPERIEDAIKHGFLLMPSLDATLEGRPIDSGRMTANATSYPYRDSVALWDLGDHLGRARDLPTRGAELDRIRGVVSGLKAVPKGLSRLSTATVEGNFPLLASAPKNLSVVGVRPNLWGSAQEPIDSYFYMKQRRDLTSLANPDGLFLAWLPVTPPAAFRTAIWGVDATPSWGIPQVQPEQLRMFTYMALSAGYRGIGYLADADLTRNTGRMMLIEMALLNEEIDLCESILANGADPIPLYYTFIPDPPSIPPPGSPPTAKVAAIKEFEPFPGIRAAAISTRDRRGKLLLVASYGDGAQYQPTQMALNNLKITVPSAESAQAYEISPGEVKVLERERVPGGTRVTVPDFGPTALILVTTDVELIERIRAAIERVRPLAVQLAIEQAQLQLRWVSEINDRIVSDGYSLYDEKDPNTPPLAPGAPKPNEETDLLKKSEESIKAARDALEREDYPLAWSEARRASRPLRHLMFNQWMKAFQAMQKVVSPPEPKPPGPRRGRTSVKEMMKEEYRRRERTNTLVLPVCSPPLASYSTLPQHYIWLDWMRKPFGRNLVPSGSFDDHASLESTGWINQSYQVERIVSKVLTVPDETDKTRRVLKMTVQPAEGTKIDALPPYLDFPVAAIRTPPIRVQPGQFLKISVLFKKMTPTPPGSGGLIVTDSIGGEPLQFRTGGAFTKFNRIVLFRRAPSKGVMTVTFGLAGFGEVFFDDFKVETVEDQPRDPADDFAGRPRAGDDTSPATARRPSPRFRTSQ